MRANVEGNTGFIKDRQRLNVCLSRAKGGRICFADAATLYKKTGHLAKLVEHYYAGSACYSMTQFQRMLVNQPPGEYAARLESPYGEIPLMARLAACDIRLMMLRESQQADTEEYFALLREKSIICVLIKNYVQINAAIESLEILQQHQQCTSKDKRRLAICYRYLGQFDLAVQVLQEESLEESMNLKYQLDRVRCYLDMENYENAFAILEKLYQAQGADDEVCCAYRCSRS